MLYLGLPVVSGTAAFFYSLPALRPGIVAELGKRVYGVSEVGSSC